MLWKSARIAKPWRNSNAGDAIGASGLAISGQPRIVTVCTWGDEGMKMRGMLVAASALAMLAPGAAQAKWYKVTSPHFTVYAEGEPADLKDYIAKLERYDSAMHVLYAVPAQPPSSSSRVTVFVVRDVQKVTGIGGILGVYMPRAGGPVAFSAKYGEDTIHGISRLGSSYVPVAATPQQVLFHEYAHHFMYTSWPDIPFPTWLSEGFAEYNGTAIINDDGSVSIWIAPERPAEVAESQWLPSPAGGGFSLNLRLYVARKPALAGEWFPPPIARTAAPE